MGLFMTGNPHNIRKLDGSLLFEKENEHFRVMH